MNEQIKQEILKYLQTFAGAVEKSANFSAEQAPLVVQEFIRWEIFGGLFVFVVCSVIVFFILKTGIRIIKLQGDDNEAKMFFAFVTLVIGIFPLLMGLCNLSSNLKALVAPRVVIIEKISELTKGIAK